MTNDDNNDDDVDDMVMIMTRKEDVFVSPSMSSTVALVATLLRVMSFPSCETRNTDDWLERISFWPTK